MWYPRGLCLGAVLYESRRCRCTAQPNQYRLLRDYSSYSPFLGLDVRLFCNLCSETAVKFLIKTPNFSEGVCSMASHTAGQDFGVTLHIFKTYNQQTRPKFYVFLLLKNCKGSDYSVITQFGKKSFRVLISSRFDDNVWNCLPRSLCWVHSRDLFIVRDGSNLITRSM